VPTRASRRRIKGRCGRTDSTGVGALDAAVATGTNGRGRLGLGR
jgi:hypothetical protein